MKYLNKDYKNIEELKRDYRDLVKKFHPDVNPKGLEITQEINQEYETLFPKVKRQTGANTDEKAGDFIDLINNIIDLDLTIEIIGTWVWVSGDTYPYKEELKKNGFKWASKKKMWYKKPKGSFKKTKKQFTHKEIKSFYNVETVKKQSKVKSLK